MLYCIEWWVGKHRVSKDKEETANVVIFIQLCSKLGTYRYVK